MFTLTSQRFTVDMYGNDLVDAYALPYTSEQTAKRAFNNEIARLSSMMQDDTRMMCALLHRANDDGTRTCVGRWYVYGQNA